VSVVLEQLAIENGIFVQFGFERRHVHRALTHAQRIHQFVPQDAEDPRLVLGLRGETVRVHPRCGQRFLNGIFRGGRVSQLQPREAEQIAPQLGEVDRIVRRRSSRDGGHATFHTGRTVGRAPVAVRRNAVQRPAHAAAPRPLPWAPSHGMAGKTRCISCFVMSRNVIGDCRPGQRADASVAVRPMPRDERRRGPAAYCRAIWRYDPSDPERIFSHIPHLM
jgi:hypothetical protein